MSWALRQNALGQARDSVEVKAATIERRFALARVNAQAGVGRGVEAALEDAEAAARAIVTVIAAELENTRRQIQAESDGT